MSDRRLPVSVIICAYTEDRWEALIAAVRSVQAQTVPPEEIVIVIDHCADLLSRARWSLPTLAPGAPLRITENSGPKGLSGARNTGVSRALASVVAFLDDDARAAPDWLERLCADYVDPEVMGVGGRVIPAWEDERPGWFPPEFDWVVGCTHRGVRPDAGPVRNFVGANMSFRHSVVGQAGGFRTDLGRIGTTPLGCEETELCIRIAQRPEGGVLLYNPDAQVFHTVPRSRTTWRYFRSRCYAEGLSKAAVSQSTGRNAALATERSYVLRVLPGGIISSFRRGQRGWASRPMRAAAIVAGTGLTALGYLAGNRGPKKDPARRADPTARPAPALLLPVVLLAGGLGSWAVSLGHHKPLSTMTDLGLMSVLPVSFWLGLGLVTAAFCIAVTRRQERSWLPPACVLALIAMLHATPTILYGTLRYSWAWKHVAVIDYILRHGRLNLNLSQLSAYQAWPGFFTANAVLDRAGGLSSSLSYASWAPVIFEVAFLGPLLLIFRQFTTDKRLVWTGVWFFYLGNWIGQDYLSPQATAYFLYLVVLAVIVRWLLPARSMTKAGAESANAARASAPPGKLALLVLVPMIVGIATIHQLTPLMLLSALVALWLFRQGLPKRVLILAGVITIGWILIAARSFLASNLYWIVESIGHPDANTKSTLVDLSQVTHGQVIVAKIDRLLSAGIWMLAVVGVWRRRRYRRLDRPFLLLALSPLPLIVSNNYGGEMLFRVFFFALPFVAIFAASSLFPSSRKGRSWLASVSLFVVAALLLGGFSFSYYGKEQANYFSPEEVAAGTWVYSNAPPRSLILSVTSNWPYSFQHYELYDYEWFALDSATVRRDIMRDPAATLAKIMAAPRHPTAYLVFTRGQAAEVAGLGLLPAGAVDRVEQAVLQSPDFRVVYRNNSALVLTLQPDRPPS